MVVTLPLLDLNDPRPSECFCGNTGDRYDLHCLLRIADLITATTCITRPHRDPRFGGFIDVDHSG